MLILNSINAAFVHIPKNGGSGITEAINLCPPDTWFNYSTVGAHASIEKMLAQDIGRFIKKFIIQVRNPYQRFISAYYHQKSHHGLDFHEMIECLNDESKIFPDDKLLIPQHHFIKVSSSFQRNYFTEFKLQIFRLEDKDIWQYLRDNGYPVFERHIRKTQNKRIRLTNTQKEIIYNYYKKDFQKFGYKA